MQSDVAIGMLTDLFWTGFIVCLPILGMTMVVGLLISIAQVVTQVQEMSLTFVPKLFTAGVAIIMFGPWILKTVKQYATNLWVNIPSLL